MTNPAAQDPNALVDAGVTPESVEGASEASLAESCSTATSPEASAVDPNSDLMSQILAATGLEQSDQREQAILIYRRVMAADPEGMYGSMASKALDAMGAFQEKPEPEAVASTTSQPMVIPADLLQASTWQRQSAASPLLRWFRNLSIGRKQLMFLGFIELTVLALLGAGALLINQSLRNQLVAQSRSELSMAEGLFENSLDRLSVVTRNRAEEPVFRLTARSFNTDGTNVVRSPQVRELLEALAVNQQLEYATLVGANRTIIQGANVDRFGDPFDPDGLVSAVLSSPRQIQAMTIMTNAELTQELGEVPEDLENRDVLVQLILTPIVDPSSTEPLAVLVAGNIVNTDPSLWEESLQRFGVQVGESALRKDGGYTGLYMHQEGEFSLAVSAFQASEGFPRLNEDLDQTQPALNLLQQAVEDPRLLPHNGRLSVGGQSYTVAAKALPNRAVENAPGEFTGASVGEPVALLVRGTPETSLQSLFDQTLVQLLGAGILVVIVHLILAALLGQSITRPLQKLGSVARSFAKGERETRADIDSADEVGQLALTFNAMADNIVGTEETLARQSAQQQQEAERQRQLRESLQQGVIDLLLEIEGAQQGNLTVQASVTEGEVGSIADAFNATLRSLRQLATQVRVVVNRVNQLAHQSELSADKLSPNALKQTAELNRALLVVENSTTVVQRVSESAREAADTAEYGTQLARVGDDAMTKTVESMDKIRETAADTAKQVKRLAESSQEISQIVSIIAGIADRTNLLAFNAALEAARAGEHGQGFRQIADEVRRLAMQVNDFAQEIEQLIGGIQQETADVIRGMEINTTEVVNGTQFVNQTQVTLQELVSINREIDQYLDSISNDAQAQTQMAQQVNDVMASVAGISENTSTEAQGIVTSLQELVHEVEALQVSVSKFQVGDTGQVGDPGSQERPPSQTSPTTNGSTSDVDDLVGSFLSLS